MSYALHYGSGVERDLSRLPHDRLVRIDRAIFALGDAPRPKGSIKLAGGSDLWRIRVGDYRIVYAIDDAAQVVEILVVAHRREVYRRL